MAFVDFVVELCYNNLSIRHNVLLLRGAKMEKGLLKLEQGDLLCVDDGCIDNEFKGVWFDLVCPTDTLDENRTRIQQGLSEVEQQLSVVNSKVAELNADIEKLTNNADGIDYAIAVTCGVITGIIDSIFVGEWDFKNAKAVSNKKINDKVLDFAKKDPQYAEFIKNKRKNNDPNRLDNAIEFLESKYKLPGDGAYKGFKDLGITDASHHLDDFCHHPTLVGLICCVLVQFTGSATYRSSSGAVVKTPIEVNEYGKLVSENKWGKILAGVINWFFNVAQTVANRKGHLLSDIAGSSTSVGKGNEGAGVPGSMLSLAKELSALPCFKDTNFAENLRKAYQNGIGSGDKQLDLGAFNSLFEGASSKMDVRTEMAIAHELKRQAIPVIINEILVRGIYFVRRFILEMKEKNSIKDIEWANTLPFKNRTIVRMMTIATGTFTAIDMADAGIRAVIKSGGFNPATLGNFILRVNFVGVGRFAVAVATDVGMGVKKGIKENKRLNLVSEQLQLMNVKVSYQQADMWVSAKDAGEAINEAYQMVVPTVQTIVTKWAATDKNVENIVTTLEEENEDEALANAFVEMFDEN